MKTVVGTEYFRSNIYFQTPNTKLNKQNVSQVGWNYVINRMKVRVTREALVFFFRILCVKKMLRFMLILNLFISYVYHSRYCIIYNSMSGTILCLNHS